MSTTLRYGENWGASAYYRAKTGRMVTCAMIAAVKAWVNRRLGVKSALVILAGVERHRVVLRFCHGGLIYEAEVARLNAVRLENGKGDAKTAPDRMMALFDAVTV